MCYQQEASADEVVRQSKFDASSAFFEVPARTAAVFVEKRWFEATPFYISDSLVDG